MSWGTGVGTPTPTGAAGGDLGGTYPNPTVDAATTTAAGKGEIATQAEADAGTDTTRWITPETLSNYSGLGTASRVILYDSGFIGATTTTLDSGVFAGTLNHLEVRMYLRSERAGSESDTCDVFFNADQTSANYDGTQHNWTSTPAEGVSAQANNAAGANCTGATAAADRWGFTIMRVPFYRSSGKKARWAEFYLSITTRQTNYWTTDWDNTAEITRVQVKTQNGDDFIAGSRLIVYDCG